MQAINQEHPAQQIRLPVGGPSRGEAATSTIVDLSGDSEDEAGGVFLEPWQSCHCANVLKGAGPQLAASNAGICQRSEDFLTLLV